MPKLSSSKREAFIIPEFVSAGDPRTAEGSYSRGDWGTVFSTLGLERVCL